jgi:hypothetical protein
MYKTVNQTHSVRLELLDGWNEVIRIYGLFLLYSFFPADESNLYIIYIKIINGMMKMMMVL